MLAVEYPLVRASVAAGAEAADDGAVDVDGLDAAKARVPRVGKARWDAALAATGRAAAPVASTDRPVSRAFFKLREIVLSCGLPRARRSVHLGEAPGGFVQATAAHADASDWQWRAVSLEAAGAPRPAAALQTLSSAGHFLAGVPAGSDLLDAACRDHVVAAVRRDFADGADLVTADGAAEMDHSRLEADHAPLLAAQTDVALRALGRGGTYVVKFYEGRDPRTRRWAAALSTRFRATSVVKPTWSRPTNSERYLVCRGFEGDAAPLPPSCTVAAAWCAEWDAVTHRLAREQATALRAALQWAEEGGKGT